MKIIIRRASYNDRGVEDLLETYPAIKKFICCIDKSTYRDNDVYIEINSLDELIKLSEELDKDIIIEDQCTLIIYDAYIE